MLKLKKLKTNKNLPVDRANIYAELKYTRWDLGLLTDRTCPCKLVEKVRHFIANTESPDAKSLF